MREPWTGELVGRMHNEEVTYQELAEEAGVVKGYVSQILNGTRSPKRGREKLEGAFESILRRRMEEQGLNLDMADKVDKSLDAEPTP